MKAHLRCILAKMVGEAVLEKMGYPERDILDIVSAVLRAAKSNGLKHKADAGRPRRSAKQELVRARKSLHLLKAYSKPSAFETAVGGVVAEEKCFF